MSSSRVILWSLSFGCCPPRCLLVVFWRLSAGLFSRSYPLGLSSRSFHLGLTSEVVFCLTSGYCHLGFSSGCCALRYLWMLSSVVGLCHYVLSSWVLVWMLSSGYCHLGLSSEYHPLGIDHWTFPY